MNRKSRKASRTPVITGIAALVFAAASLLFFFWLYHTLHGLETQTLNTDPALTVTEGVFVSIDYVGYLNGEELPGGSTGGRGEKLLIGSDSYLDGFEDQLIGHHPGETVEVTVTFPEDHAEEELRNKEVVYVTTIHGIYE